MAGLYKSLGLLDTDHVWTTRVSAFLGGGVNGEKKMVEQQVESAQGGTLVIDAAHGKLYLRPNAGFAEPFDCPVQGFSATYRTQTLGCWTVNSLYDGSNAQKAGLRGGDRIVAVNGRDVKTYSYQAYRTWSDGLQSVTLTVLRDGQEQEISFDFDAPKL